MRLALTFGGPHPPLRQPLPPRDPRFVHGPAELCQLAAKAPAELPAVNAGPNWVMEEKFDGVRLLWKAGTLLTREGNPAPFAEHLCADFQRLERRCGQRMFFDCEYVEPEGFLATLKTMRRGEGKGVAHVFDCLPSDAWQDGGGGPLSQRRPMLVNAFGEWRPTGLRLVKQWPTGNPSVVEMKAREIWSFGGEGIVLKNRMARYERRRSAMWIKFTQGRGLTTSLRTY